MPSPNPEVNEGNKKTAAVDRATQQQQRQASRETQPLDIVVNNSNPANPAHECHQSAENYPKSKLALNIILTVATVGAFVAAATYAYFAHQQVAAMQDTVSKTQALIDQASKQTDIAATQAKTAQTELQLSQRPWVLALSDIDKPLTFLENGSAVLELKQTFQNSGGSVAINVGWWADMVPLDHNYNWDAGLLRQTEYCDKHRLWKNEPKGNLSGFIIFPKQEIESTMVIAVVGADVTKTIAASTDPLKRIGFVVVGCAWYRTLFESEAVPAHETRFAYLLGKPEGPPEGTFAAMQSGISFGTQPMVEPKGTPEGLRLVPQPMGNYAD